MNRKKYIFFKNTERKSFWETVVLHETVDSTLVKLFIAFMEFDLTFFRSENVRKENVGASI